MRTVYISRKEHFNAAHKLWNPAWTEEKNLDIFGKCANANWHGHNYELLITVKGTPQPETGYVVDLKKLSLVIKERIIEKLDHKNINLDVDFMRGIMASTENLVFAIWEIMAPEVAKLGGTLHCVRLYETSNNFAEYYGD